MTDLSTDAVVIGTGPGGEGAAMQLAKAGKKVVVIERHSRIGGGCTHWGTIPSKALKFAISQLTDAINNPILMECGIKPKPTIAQLTATAQKVISEQESMRRKFYSRNNCELISGHARFEDANTISVEGGPTITTESVVIGVGSRPYHPPDLDFEHERVFDSDTILNLEKKPKSLTIFGAGVIGCEYASMFRNLSIKINLINGRGELLDFLDNEISDALSYHMRERGVVIRHNEQLDRVETLDDGVVVHLKSGKQVKSDALLWAAGRTGNTDSLGLDKIGIEPDSRGYVSVDRCYKTEVDNVYAVGDVVGFPSLASAAYTQGRAAAKAILQDKDAACELHEIPSGIYTTPEISCIGRTEEQLTEDKVPYEVGICNFKQLARAQILRQNVGMLKLLFHRETLEVLGVHCFGPNASEIVHIGQAVMSDPAVNTVEYFVKTTFNYPTMAEAYRVAALNGINRLF